jgi:hypothetical protein
MNYNHSTFLQRYCSTPWYLILPPHCSFFPFAALELAITLTRHSSVGQPSFYDDITLKNCYMMNLSPIPTILKCLSATKHEQRDNVFPSKSVNKIITFKSTAISPFPRKQFSEFRILTQYPNALIKSFAMWSSISWPSRNVCFEVSKRGEEEYRYECSFAMWSSISWPSRNVCFEVSKRGEEESYD